MPLYKITRPLDQEATLIHEKMGKAWDDLCNAASALSELEERYDLLEDSIEMIGHTYTNMYELLQNLKYEIDEAENWMFNGYSLQEIDTEEENYEDHKDKDGE